VAKFLAVLFLLTLTVGMSCLAMIYGWGLQPRSWWWIIGVGIVLNLVIRMVSDAVLKENQPRTK
jgi:hypothetical protein